MHHAAQPAQEYERDVDVSSAWFRHLDGRHRPPRPRLSINRASRPAGWGVRRACCGWLVWFAPGGTGCATTHPHRCVWAPCKRARETTLEPKTLSLISSLQLALKTSVVSLRCVATTCRPHQPSRLRLILLSTFARTSIVLGCRCNEWIPKQ